MQNITFRRALPREIPQILAMQSEIFYREQGIPKEDPDDFLAKKPVFWCAESDGNLYGAAAAWEEDGQLHWGRFFIIPSMRRQHLGAALAQHAFQDLFRSGVEEIHMTARDITVSILCRMGGQVVGEAYPFYNGNITPVLLKKADYVRQDPIF